MDGWIIKNRGAFIEGRQLQNNILVANEVFHHLKNRKQGKKFEIALKVDMNKAYDRVKRDFLGVVMGKMGFSVKWISWILKCIPFVAYNLIVQGKLSDTVHHSKGMRQGDPLSPCLFLSVIDVMSRVINRAIESESLEV